MRIKPGLKACESNVTKLQSFIATSRFQACTPLAPLLSRGAHLHHSGQATLLSPLPTASPLLVLLRLLLLSCSRLERGMLDILCA